ncbi:MAG: cell division ATP-binding protein FtsE [Erysipelotrichales bacterium]|nr:cell division ATP-binding protein FtsE [Erysipelotrichales bacterium]
MILELNDVNKIYPNGVNALHDVNLEIEEGEFVYIIGATGSGKSTLIKLIDGEEVPTSGTVISAGVNVGKLRHSKVPLYRRNIGVVFQDFKLLPQKTTFENVAFALEVINMSDLEIRKRVRHVLNLVGLEDKAKAFPRELSGGQQQRVAIARAIANKPKILIADEPTGNLDPETAKGIMELLNLINEQEGSTILMVTHDMSIVEQFRHRTIRLEDGYIVADFQKGGYDHYVPGV